MDFQPDLTTNYGTTLKPQSTTRTNTIFTLTHLALCKTAFVMAQALATQLELALSDGVYAGH